MPGQRITLVADFDTLIARAGFSKEAFAKAAGINRGVIYRAMSPETYRVGGGITNTTAWKMAKAYAERADLDLTSAFARLFVVMGESPLFAYEPVDAVLDGGVGREEDTPAFMEQPRHQEPSAFLSNELKKPANLRLDTESVVMLDALMQDEDRSSQRDMIRVLIKRAYRALVARQTTPDTTRLDASSIDERQGKP